MNTVSDAERLFVNHNFNTIPARELYGMIVGKELGNGVARRVYEYTPNIEDTVIKIEDNAGSFQNIHEYSTWHDLKDTSWGKRWLVPCVRISPCGLYLMQWRTHPPGPDFKWPKTIPWVFTDRKKENFGIYKGKLMCHDYGTLSVGFTKAAPLGKMDKARWWSVNDD